MNNSFNQRTLFTKIAEYIDLIIPDQDQFSKPIKWAKIIADAYHNGDDGNTLEFGYEVLTQMPITDALQSVLCLILVSIDMF